MKYSIQGIIPDIIQRMKSGSYLIVSVLMYQEQYKTSVILAKVHQGNKNISHFGTGVSRRRDMSHFGICVSRRQNINHLANDVSRKWDISHLGKDKSGRSKGKEKRRTGGWKHKYERIFFFSVFSSLIFLLHSNVSFFLNSNIFFSLQSCTIFFPTQRSQSVGIKIHP